MRPNPAQGGAQHSVQLSRWAGRWIQRNAASLACSPGTGFRAWNAWSYKSSGHDIHAPAWDPEDTNRPWFPCPASPRTFDGPCLSAGKPELHCTITCPLPCFWVVAWFSWIFLLGAAPLLLLPDASKLVILCSALGIAKGMCCELSLALPLGDKYAALQTTVCLLRQIMAYSNSWGIAQEEYAMNHDAYAHEGKSSTFCLPLSDSWKLNCSILAFSYQSLFLWHFLSLSVCLS